MRVFEGCVEAKEISLTRKGANPMAFALVTKNAAGTTAVVANPTHSAPENEMTPADVAKAMAKFAAMDEATKAYYIGLDEPAQIAFLEKSAADMKADAEAAAEVAKKAAEAEALKTAGKSAKEAELEKSLSETRGEIAALKADKVERDMEKRANDEFDGFPGGAAKLVPMMKSIAGLPDDQKAAIEETWKAQATLAKSTTRQFGSLSEVDIAKRAPSTDKIQKKAAEIAKAEGISHAAAVEKLSDLPEWQEDFTNALNEEDALLAAE